MTKRERYEQLVRRRKQCHRCIGLTNPCSVVPMSLDSNEIGPYTRWHSDLNARLVVVGKDFAPVDKFKECGGRPSVDVETNKRLVRYMRIAGFNAGAINHSHHDSGLFFTNAVLCLPGGTHMRTKVLPKDVRNCSGFLRETLDIVSPKAIAALGVHATNAVFQAYGLSISPDSAALAKSTLDFRLPSGIVLFAMPHPVASIQKSEQEVAWRRIRLWFEAARHKCGSPE